MVEERDDLLDLPLPGGDAGNEPEPPQTFQRSVPVQRRRRAGLLTALLVVAAAVGGYFFPRPGPPVLASLQVLLDFEQQRVDEATPERAIELRNEGERLLRISEVRLEGTDPADVELTSDECSGSELEPQAECTVLLQFTPRQIGNRGATLLVFGEAPNSPLRVPIRGMGIEPGLAPDPTRRTFPSLVLGDTGERQVVRLRNNGSAPLSIERVAVEGASRRDFIKRSDTCSGKTLDPDRTCEIALLFSPKAIGERQATLTLYSDAPGEPSRVALIATSVRPQPLVAVDSESLSFPEQLVGTSSETVRLRIRNRGTGGLEIEEIELVDSDPAFYVEPGDCGTKPLSGTDQCELQVRFEPGREGPIEARMRIASNTEEGPTTILLAGVGIQARLELSVNEVDFGALALGDTRTQELKLSNSGSAPLRIARVTLARQVTRSFSIEQDGCSDRSLEPAQICSLTLSFQARNEGHLKSDLTIMLSSSSRPVHVPLSGQGAVGRLQLSKNEIDFGNVPVGSSERQRLTLTNSGSASLGIVKVAIDTVAAADFRIVANGCTSQPDLSPDTFCTVVLEHAPATAGRRNAELLIEHDGTGSSHRVQLRARGVLPDTPPLRLAPRRLDFGDQLIDRRSDIETVILHNTGSGPVEIGSIRLAGPSAEQFEIIDGSCQATPYLAADADCTFGIRFSPRFVGEIEAIATIENGASERPLTVPLRGRGTEPVPDPPPAPDDGPP